MSLADTVDTLLTVGAGLFFLEFLAYAVIGYLKFEERYRALSEVLYDSLFVTGLNMYLYAYRADGGALQWVWLVYSFSCVKLAVSFYRLLTYHYHDECKRVKNAATKSVSIEQVRDIEAERSYEYMMMLFAVFLTLISGLVINLLASSMWRWIVFGVSFVPFLFAALYFFRAVNMRTGGETVAKYWIRVVVYVTMVFWLGYPIVMVMGPLFFGWISSAGEALGYILLDLVTKHLFMALSVYYMYTEAPETDASAPSMRPNRRPTYF